MGGGWQIGRLAGVAVRIHPSWLVIALLVTYSLAASQFPETFPGWTQNQYWIVGGATALLFFASVLAHEMSTTIIRLSIYLSPLQNFHLRFFLPLLENKFLSPFFYNNHTNRCKNRLKHICFLFSQS